LNLPQQTYTGLEDIELKRKREKEQAEAKRKKQAAEKRKRQVKTKKPNPNSAYILLLLGAVAACGIYYLLAPSNYWQRLISIAVSTGLFGMFGFYFVQVYRRIG